MRLRLLVLGITASALTTLGAAPANAAPPASGGCSGSGAVTEALQPTVVVRATASCSRSFSGTLTVRVAEFRNGQRTVHTDWCTIPEAGSCTARVRIARKQGATYQSLAPYVQGLFVG